MGKLCSQSDATPRYASMRQSDPLIRTSEGCQGLVRRAVKHPSFDFFFAFVVLSNSIFIGVEVQLGLESHGSRPMAIYAFQYTYTFLFCLELGMRLLADCRFYLCDEWMWRFGFHDNQLFQSFLFHLFSPGK